MHGNNDRWAPISEALLAVGLLIFALTGCGAGGEAAAQKAKSARETEPIAGQFVGAVLDTGALFALVADEPEGGKREVRAYLCDGKQLSEWFTATTSANEVRLSSESGVEIEVSITPQEATGTITTSAGEPNDAYGFRAPAAEGVEGFYPVVVPAGEGPLNAEGWGGTRLEGTREGEWLSLVLTSEDGEAIEPEAQAPGLEAGENRWIFSREGGRLLIKGASKGAATTGFIDPVSDLRKPGFIDPTTDI